MKIREPFKASTTPQQPEMPPVLARLRFQKRAFFPEWPQAWDTSATAYG